VVSTYFACAPCFTARPPDEEVSACWFDWPLRFDPVDWVPSVVLLPELPPAICHRRFCRYARQQLRQVARKTNEIGKELACVRGPPGVTRLYCLRRLEEGALELHSTLQWSQLYHPAI
jgi:hypothetical protein